MTPWSITHGFCMRVYIRKKKLFIVFTRRVDFFVIMAIRMQKTIPIANMSKNNIIGIVLKLGNKY
jgi:hypothetical protein